MATKNGVPLLRCTRTAGRYADHTWRLLAQVYNGMGEYFAGIDRDATKNRELVAAEIAHFPNDESKHFLAFVGALVADKQVDEAYRTVEERASVVFAHEASSESDLLNAANGYEYYLRDKPTADSLKNIIVAPVIIGDPRSSKPATMTESQWKKNAEFSYRNNADTYALIRYEQGDLADALAYQRKAIGEYGSAEVNERFVLFLKESGELDEAQAAAEKSIESGYSREVLKGYLKTIYSDQGHDVQEWTAYIGGLDERHLAEVRKKLIATLIDEEAPQFSLVNMKVKRFRPNR